MLHIKGIYIFIIFILLFLFPAFIIGMFFIFHSSNLGFLVDFSQYSWPILYLLQDLIFIEINLRLLRRKENNKNPKLKITLILLILFAIIPWTPQLGLAHYLFIDSELILFYQKYHFLFLPVYFFPIGILAERIVSLKGEAENIETKIVAVFWEFLALSFYFPIGLFAKHDQYKGLLIPSGKE